MPHVYTIGHSTRSMEEFIQILQTGISYMHMPELGGLRRPHPDSQNTGWRNLSFRGFADYMQTDEFEISLGKLIEIAGHRRIALMCAEAVPWHCHRSLIADALFVRNIKVEHILSISHSMAHSITPWALVNGISITYPRPETTDEIIKE